MPRSVHWSGGPEAEREQSGDIGSDKISQRIQLLLQLLMPRSVRWSGGPEADLEQSGDNGLSGSAEESNHCCTNTLQDLQTCDHIVYHNVGCLLSTHATAEKVCCTAK